MQTLYSILAGKFPSTYLYIYFSIIFFKVILGEVFQILCFQLIKMPFFSEMGAEKRCSVNLLGSRGQCIPHETCSSPEDYGAVCR